MDGKHSMRLQNVNVYVWTGPQTKQLFNHTSSHLINHAHKSTSATAAAIKLLRVGGNSLIFVYLR